MSQFSRNRILLLAVLFSSAQSVLAGPLVYKSNGDYNTMDASEPIVVELTPGGKKVLKWQGVKGQRFLIHFSAECNVNNSSDNGTSVGISIQAKSPGKGWLPLKPTIDQGSAVLERLPRAACMSKIGDDILSNVSLAVDYKARSTGTQKVRVMANLQGQNGTEYGWLRGTELVVSD